MYNPADEVSSINFGSIIGGALNAVVDAQRHSAETTVNFIRNVGFMPGAVDAKTGENVGIGDPICVSFSYDKEVSPSQMQTTRSVGVKVVDGGSGYDPTKPVMITIGDNAVEGADVKISSEGVITEVLFTTVPTGDYITNGVSVTASQESGEEGGESNSSAKLEILIEEENQSVPALYQKMQIDVPILTMMPIPFIKIDNTDIEFNVKINSVSNSKSNESSNSNVTNNTSFRYKGWGINAGTSLNASISNQKSTTSSEEVKKDYSLNIKIHAVQDEMPAGMSRILDILEESIVTKPVSFPAQKKQEQI